VVAHIVPEDGRQRRTGVKLRAAIAHQHHEVRQTPRQMAPSRGLRLG
jgi:hypothetical protein